MVFEKPLIDARELMRALDPLHGRGEGEYARLRREELLSGGVTTSDIRLTGSGRALTLYCSLNRDAISAVRRGHTEIAREISEHAERIERDVLAPWLTNGAPLSSTAEIHTPEVGEADGRNDWIDDVFFAPATTGHAELAEPVLAAAREVAEVRDRYDEDANVRLTIARVWKIEDVFSEVRPEAPAIEESFAFFTEEVLAAGLRLGDPVVIRHEELGPGVFLTTLERGLEPASRLSRVTGHPLPSHLDELLNASPLSRRSYSVRPLRRVA